MADQDIARLSGKGSTQRQRYGASVLINELNNSMIAVDGGWSRTTATLRVYLGDIRRRGVTRDDYELAKSFLTQLGQELGFEEEATRPDETPYETRERLSSGDRPGYND